MCLPFSFCPWTCFGPTTPVVPPFSGAAAPSSFACASPPSACCGAPSFPPCRSRVSPSICLLPCPSAAVLYWRPHSTTPSVLGTASVSTSVHRVIFGYHQPFPAPLIRMCPGRCVHPLPSRRRPQKMKNRWGGGVGVGRRGQEWCIG